MALAWVLLCSPWNNPSRSNPEPHLCHTDSPAKSLPMQAFMLYMSGSGVQIFSMGIVWMLLTSPWSAVMQLLQGAFLGGNQGRAAPTDSPQTVFEPYKQTVLVGAGGTAPGSSRAGAGQVAKRVVTTELALPMLVYVLCQILV